MDLTHREERLLRLLSDIVSATKAKQQLDAGFSGMGINILGESASRLGGLIRKAEWEIREAYPEEPMP